MFSLARTVLTASKKLYPSCITTSSNFHSLISPNLRNVPHIPLLAASTSSLMPSCGFKVKGLLKRRCKDCFFVRREERLYVICKTHGRHKQMSMVKKPKSTWILTHATQSKTRPW